MASFCTKLRRIVLTCDKILSELVRNLFAYSTEIEFVEKSVENSKKVENKVEIMLNVEKSVEISWEREKNRKETNKHVRFQMTKLCSLAL